MILLIIVFLLILMAILIFIYRNNYLIENLDTDNDSKKPDDNKYTPIDTNDPLILAKTNAANITFLESKIKNITNLQNELNDINNKIKSNTIQISGVRDSIASAGYSTVGGKPPKDQPLPTITDDE
jgi:hypothetical protein